MGIVQQFFDLIRLEIDSIDDSGLIEPTESIRPGERQVCRLGPDLRRLWTRMEQATANAVKYAADARLATIEIEKDREFALGKALELTVKADFFRALVFLCVREDRFLWRQGKLMVRQGWVVVVCSPPPDFRLGIIDPSPPDGA